ncbi:MAG: hypothetical protein R3A49_13475 [Acidimicrobiia bacterium]
MTVFVEIVRLLIVVLATAAGFWIGRDVGPESASLTAAGLGGMLGCLAGYVTGGVLGRLLEKGVGVVERRVERLPAAGLLAGAAGGVLGAMAGLVASVPVFVLVEPRLSIPIAGLLIWVFGYTAFRVAAHKSEELFQLLGLSTRPLIRATPYASSDGYLVDTSAVMDGQLLTLVRTGLFSDDLLVPRFVLDEIQGFADSTDPQKSRRARRGMEGLDVLRKEGPVRVYVLDDEVPEIEEVDAKLVALAGRLQLRLLTNDAPLARNAEIQGVPTCNLRRLASDLSPRAMPGDRLDVELTRPGREPGQGVGYLDDGTMVVVNDGADLVGAGTVALEATSVVPTSMGHIVFARPEPDSHTDECADLGDRRGGRSG